MFLTVVPWTDVIQAAAAIGSVVAAVVALVISVKTLKQNSKMIEEASRPYITISFDCMFTNEQVSFFIIRNFGRTAARIVEFKYDEELKNFKQEFKISNDQFDRIKGMEFAPDQKKILYYDVNEFPERDIEFTISYTSGKKEYSETFIMNPRKYFRVPQRRYKVLKAEDQMMALNWTIQEILSRLV